MTDWKALPVGGKQEVDDNGTTALVHRTETMVYVIMRHFEGGWRPRIWIRGAGDGWRMTDQEWLAGGDRSEDLQALMTAGLLRSRLTPPA